MSYLVPTRALAARARLVRSIFFPTCTVSAARVARFGPACAPLKPPVRNLIRPRQRGPSPSVARSLATSPQPRTPQLAQSVAARSLQPRALPVATRSLQPRAASRHTQPSGRSCLLPAVCSLPAACRSCLPPACFLLPAACLLLAACCRLPACCLLPHACSHPAACLLLAAYSLPACLLAACLPPACCLPAAACLPSVVRPTSVVRRPSSPDSRRTPPNDVLRRPTRTDARLARRRPMHAAA
ncbi:unnamed protein product [Closterium sp. NIES-54]